MTKLIYPDGKMTDQEAFELIDFAAESRKRVKDQLYIIDETFNAEPALFKYINLKNGKDILVETLENVSNALTVPVNTELNDDDTQPQNTDLSISGTTSVNNDITQKMPHRTSLQERSLSVRLGQTGVNYEKLFSSYLENATEITVEDPYIRTSWQVKNFMEFVTMLINTRPVDDLKLHLVTNEEDKKLPDLIDRLDDIKNDLINYGIEFDYKFQDFHDRCIKTDTGWTIILGRGLDIFEKYNPYSVEAMRQDKRKCKDFMVTFMKRKKKYP